MTPSTLRIPLNNVQMPLAEARPAGASYVRVPAGTGAVIRAAVAELGYGVTAPATDRPIGLTLYRGTGRDDATTLLFTGIADGTTYDELTGCAVVEGTPDQSFAAGDWAEIGVSAGLLDELRRAILDTQAEAGAVAPAGGPGAVQYNEAGVLGGDAANNKIGTDGRFYMRLADSLPVDNNIINGQCTFWLDESLGSNGTFMVRARTAGGPMVEPTPHAGVTAGGSGPVQYSKGGALAGSSKFIWADDSSILTVTAGVGATARYKLVNSAVGVSAEFQLDDAGAHVVLASDMRQLFAPAGAYNFMVHPGGVVLGASALGTTPTNREVVVRGDATYPARLRIPASAAQGTTPLQVWESNAGANWDKVGSDGRFFMRLANSAPADADIADGQGVFWINEATNTWNLRARYSTGVYKSASGALA